MLVSERLCKIVKTWDQNAKVDVRTSFSIHPQTQSSDLGLVSGNSSSSYGLFARNNIDKEVEVARMIDPVIIKTEEELCVVENLLKDAPFGEIDSYVYCGSTIIWDRSFIDVNKGKRDVPYWYRMNHSFAFRSSPTHMHANSSVLKLTSISSRTSNSINVKPFKIGVNIVWKTTRRVQNGEELRYDYNEPDKNWEPSPARGPAACTGRHA
jgi:hypothetical protein